MMLNLARIFGQAAKKNITLADKNGALVEAVVMRYHTRLGMLGGKPRPGGIRSTSCISSQVGCKMDCTFCATGTMGFKSNLTSGEIVEQLVHASRIADIRNIMGMGEPLNNYNAVVEAVPVMLKQLFQLSPKRITISTVHGRYYSNALPPTRQWLNIGSRYYSNALPPTRQWLNTNKRELKRAFLRAYVIPQRKPKPRRPTKVPPADGPYIERGLESIKKQFEMPGEITRGKDQNGCKYAELVFEDMTEINELDENGDKKKVPCTYYLRFLMAGKKKTFSVTLGDVTTPICTVK